MDVRSLSTDQVDQRILRIMDGYHTVVISVQLNGLYRARKNIDDKPFERISDLWYPPAAAVRSRGRFNEVGVPVFYACNRVPGAIFEIQPQVGDLVTVLIVRTKEPFVELQCAHIGLERCFAPEIGPAQRGRMLQTNPRFQAMLERYRLSQKWLAIDQFFSDMATTQFRPDEASDKYKITNAIVRPLLRIPGVQALNYPSVASRLRNINLCLPPTAADQFFTGAEAWMIRIEDVKDRLAGLNEEGPFYRTRFVRRSLSIDPDGQISWSGELHNVQPHEIAHLTYNPRLSDTPPWER
jgi:RES domain